MRLLVLFLTLLLTPLPSAATVVYPLSLAKGWNLMGNSLTTALDVRPTFAAQTNINSIWKWNSATGSWAMYSPALDANGTLAGILSGNGYAALTSIAPGEGYWVNAAEAVTLGYQSGAGYSLANANLRPGWNLVATGDNLSPSDFNKALGATATPTGFVPINLSSLWAWNSAQANWYFYAPSLEANGGLAAYDRSKGYLDFGAATLAPGTGFWVYKPTVSAASIVGEQKIAVLLVSFPSVPLLSSVTKQLLQATYFGSTNSVDAFLREASYGRVWATGEVFGPIVLDADHFNQPYATRDAAIRAASAQVDFSRYNRIVLMIPQSSTGLESGGLASIGNETVPLSPEASITASTTWLGDASAASPADLLASAYHELGHNFGLAHARAADYGAEPLGPVGQLPAAWDQIHDYGDGYSSMGRGPGHWAAPQKAALGWLQSDIDFKSVETDGSYRLQAYEAIGNGLKALRVRRGSGNNAWLWIEYRQASAGAFDAGLAAAAFGGALLHYEDAGWNDGQLHSNLLRMNPDQGGLFFGNAALAAGASWSDPYSNLSISLNRDVSSGLQVTVSYAAPPSYSLSPASANVAASGGAVTIDVVAPPGVAWTASSSAPWMTIVSGASGTGNGQISLAVAATAVTSARWARVAVGAATAVVTQDGAAGRLSTRPTAADYSAVGGAGEIVVTANADDYAWNQTVSDSWIQSVFFSKLTETGSGTLRYIVAQNAGAARSGSIGVGDQVFTITQAAGTPQVARLAWQKLTITDAPISRLGMDSAFFPGSGETLLFGGAWDGAQFNDTWAWSGAVWTRKNPSHLPGYRSGHAMAYDAARGQIVMFGGYDLALSANSDSTWIWNGVDWAQAQPQTSPSARSQHSMVYNPDSQKILLFGGDGNDGETWEWDGANWSQKATASAPSPRQGTAMAYDAARKEIVLFGGAGATSPQAFYNDTWVWDGSQWQQRLSSASPTPRSNARIEYNPDIGQIVLIGGYGAKDATTTPPYTYIPDYREETWTWNGASWTQQFPEQSPPFSYNYGLVSDTVHRSFVALLGDDLHCAERGPHAYALTPGAGAVLLAAYRAELPRSGGSGSVAVSATVPWVTTADAWIAIIGGGAGSGSGTLSYQVSANPGTTARTGRITVNDKVFVISQAGGA